MDSGLSTLGLRLIVSPRNDEAYDSNFKIVAQAQRSPSSWDGTGNSMKPSIALAANRDAVRNVIGRFSAANPRVFGSVVRGTDQDNSDLDLLVDALPGATLFDLGGLQIELEELLGVRVDLRTPGDLPAKVRIRVLAEAKPV